MNTIIVCYCAATVFGLAAVVNCTIPSYIQVCHHDDPDLPACMKNSIEALRPRLKVGIPDLAIPSLEPFYLDNIIINSIAGPSHLGTNLTDVKIFGASDFKILSIKPTLTKNGYTFEFDILISKVHITGNYVMDTKILFLELRGNGPFNANISDYHFLCSMKGSKIEKDGQSHLNFDKMKCNIEVGKVQIFLDNLFNGNAVLGQATNAAINDNSEAFFQEIRPTVLNAIQKKFLEISNKITLKFKYEELFP